MLPFVLGGVALAATGYGIKKFFEDDENRDKLMKLKISCKSNLKVFYKIIYQAKNQSL